MPFIQVNGASLYYDTFGRAWPGQSPIVLIHGSTQTGQSCWSEVAPLLAKDYLVIVPDCRGHGQSSNPHHTYSFKELAADTAGLIRALGYERAHIIGHSNGGNVVLVTLLEHPDVVQTSVPMAANAWISPDLPEKEPHIFDPDRVAKEAPGWMDEMIALHGPTHGLDYWRELLQLTVNELIKEPNYTPEDLHKVNRPVLLIQGAQDSVNAPYRHAQFIAHHIPYAQRWIPEATGHSVHEERTAEWVERVLAFIARRGSNANECLYRYQQDHYPDPRLQPFDVRLEGDKLTGTVLDRSMLRAVREAVPTLPADDDVKVLLTQETPWLLVNRSVDDLRKNPSILSERVSQVRLGEAVRLLDQQDRWSYVRMEIDGYMGWVHTNSLYPCTEEHARDYQQACTHQVKVGHARAFASPEDTQPASLVPFCVRLPVIESQAGRAGVQLPDGRVWWLAESDLCPIPAWPQTSPEQIQSVLAMIREFVGTPYLWGGRTPFGFDCSGLASTVWSFLGLQLLRDADQQFRNLPVATGPQQAGDLLFFGSLEEEETDPMKARITHVAIAMDEQVFIHSNGNHWGIGFNSLEPANPFFRQELKDSYQGSRRPR